MIQWQIIQTERGIFAMLQSESGCTYAGAEGAWHDTLDKIITPFKTLLGARWFLGEHVDLGGTA